jgi:TP901 family phage tail tape measure protein
MADILKIPASVDLEIRQAEARAKVLADKVGASFQKIRIGGFDSTAFKQGSAALGRIRQDADQFTKSMEAANARVLAFGTAVGVIEGMRRSFLALIKTTAEVETALTRISIVADEDLKKTGTTIEQVGKQIFTVAKQTGQSFATAAESYLELSRQGLGLSQSLERTKVSLDVVRASGAEHSKVISGLTAAYNAFSDTGLTYTQIAEKIANVDAKTTTSYEGLIDILSRASSTARQTGTSFEELLAITSTLKDLTARSESVIGNAFRSISVRLLDPKIIQTLQDVYNIDTKNLDTGALLKPVEILTNISAKLKEIGDPSQRNEIIKSISGLYQADQLNALSRALADVNNIQGTYQKNLRAANEDSNVLARSSEKFAQTLGNQFKILSVQLDEFLNSLGRIGVKNPLSQLLDSFIDAGDFIQGLVDGTDAFSKTIQGIGKFLGGALFSPAVFAAIALAIGKIGVNFATFAINAGKTFLGINRAAQEQAAIQKSIAAYIQQSGANLGTLLTSEGARLNLAKQISAEWAKQAAYSKQVGAVSQVVAGSVYSSGLRVGETGPTFAKRGIRGAEGYLPDLVSGEMNDIKKGVGGASTNSKVVVMPNFPLGGGNKGLMVANSSESVVNLGGGKFGVLNPDMMGKRAASGFLKGQKLQGSSGKFVTADNIEIGLENLTQLLVGLGRTSDQIREAATNFTQSFNLNEKSLNLVVSATERYANSLKLAAERVELLAEASSNGFNVAAGEAESRRRRTPSSNIYGNIGSANASFYGGNLNSAVDVFGVGAVQRPRASSNSIYGNVGAANTFFEGGNLNSPSNIFGVQGSSQRYRQQNEIKFLQEQERKARLQALYSESLALRRESLGVTRGGGFKSGISSIDSKFSQTSSGTATSSAASANKSFNPEALQNFAIKAVIATSVLDGLTSATLRSSKETEKYADLISKIAVSAFAFQGLNQLGGFNASNIGGGKLVKGLGGALGGLLGGGGGGIGGVVSKVSKGLLAFGSGLLRFLPIVGQVALAFTILNDVVKTITGSSIVERFTGLSEAAQKAKEKFQEIASETFTPEGEFVGQTRQQALERIRTGTREIETKRSAQSVGAKEGETTGETQANILRKRIESILKSSKTGGTTFGRDSSSPGLAFGDNYGEFSQIKTVDETLFNIDNTFREEISTLLFNLATGTEEELKTLLSERGVSNIDGKTLDNAKIDDLRDAIVKQFIEFVNKTSGGFVDNLGKPRSLEAQLRLSEIFLSKPTTRPKASIEDRSNARLRSFTKDLPFLGGKTFDFPSGALGSPLRSKINTGAPSQESIQKFLETQKEIELLAFDVSNASLEAKIKALESKSSRPNLTSEEQNRIQNTISNLQAAVLENSLDQLEKQTAEDIRKVNSEKGDSLTKSVEIEKINTQFKIQSTAIEADIQKIKDGKKIRDDEFNAIQKLIPAIDMASAKLSKLELKGVRNQVSIDFLEAQSQNPNLLIPESEDLQRQIAAKQIAGFRNQIQIEKETAEKAKKELPFDENREKLSSQIDDETKKTIISLRGQIAALEKTSSYIGAVGDASVELANSIFEFSRGLGQNRAQNQFNLLQANDRSSIVSGLIGEQSFDAVSGKSGADLVSSLAEQNAIRQQQFDIATATSKVERLNLETELKLNQQIFEIKNSALSDAEKLAKIEEAMNETLKERRSFGFGVRESLSGISDEVNTFGSTFGKTATEGFRDGLVGAMQAATSQTGNLKEALIDVALTFANKLKDAALTNLANIATNALFGDGSKSSNSGGVVSAIVGGLFSGAQKRATGGMVTGGSGTKDDVPTLLMGGEYVIPKNTVSQYGKGFFDRIRNGSIGKMAQGGYFAPGIRGQGTISGKENLLDFATQTATSGRGDVISSLSATAGLVSLEPESLRLTNFARFGDSPIISATRETKDQAFQLYLGQLEDETRYQQELQEYQDNLRKAEKEKRKQFWTSLAIAAVGSAVSYGVGSLGKSSTPKALSADAPAAYNAQTGLFETIKAYQAPSSNNSFFGSLFKGLGGLFNSNKQSSPAAEQSRKVFSAQKSDGFYNPYPTKVKPATFNGINYSKGGSNRLIVEPDLPRNNFSNSPNYLLPRLNAGGYSSGAGDTQPAMLSKGEFVLNKSATDAIGDKNLYAMNRGALPSGDNDSESRIIAKLDELIQKTVAASNVSVNIEMSGGEEKSSSQQSDNQDQNPRMLAQRIKDVVVGVIREEQRNGGLLARR